MKMISIVWSLLLAACGPQAGHMAVVADTTSLELPAYDTTEDIIVHLGYTASYNHTTLLPNWVAWELTAEEVSDAFDFQCSFSRDPNVDFPKASREDYAHSGWDKGHMAPRADMKWNAQALEESYYFTNICPQNHEMNGGAWLKIEELTRRMAKRYGAVYVVCGPVVGAGRYGTIGQAGVQVPDGFFKALAVNTTEGIHTVAFLMENTPQDGSPRSYAVTVDSVESVIRRNLFPSIPEEVESAFDWNVWK